MEMIEGTETKGHVLPYIPTDLAIIIPTKNRPNEVHMLLQSITELDCEVGRIIVVASGQDIRAVVMAFAEKLPVEYFTSGPGQIMQRNKGIALLDHSTRLVATIDDDVVFYNNAVSEMIRFWNFVEPETAGIGFNIVNQPGHNHTWLRGLFGVSRPEPGKVLKCGRNTGILNIKQNIKTEWLNGGGTTWRQNILQKNPHKAIKSNWAIFEDLIFSYPLGKKYPLYICYNSQIEIDNIVNQKESKLISMYRGKTQFLWGLYFVNTNSDLSLIMHFYSEFLHLITILIKGLKNSNKFFWGVGMLMGALLSLQILIRNKTILNILEENT
jgi:glycosyltransferase involved in cell wall biosynthesis